MTILGIDLGTSKSVVGVWDYSKPYIIPHENGSLSIPSKVLITQDGDIFAGDEANRHPKRYDCTAKNITVSSVKRLMGKKGETGWGWWKTYPQEVSAFILSELKYQAEKNMNQKFTDAVIAIPSHFDENQRRATKEAAEIAGLKVRRLLNEASAAILTYGHYRKKDGKVLVCDFGGGTLDVSIIDIGENIYEVLAIEGESMLGGDDFDQLILDYVLSQFKEKYKVEPSLDETQNLILKEMSENAKIELSSSSSSRIYLPGFINHQNNRYDIDVTINKETFAQLSNNILEQTIKLIKKTLTSAGLEARNLDSLLLIGGTSRIPSIREKIISELHVQPFVGANAETSVAEGAAILAGILGGSKVSKDILLLDVIPSSYGVETTGGKFNKMISKNTTIPTEKKEVFSTATDRQTQIDVRVFQGENEFCKDNGFVGIVKLSDIPPAPKGIPQIEVTFNVDHNMIIRVSAKDLATGKDSRAEVQSPYGLNQTQLKVMKKKMESWIYNRDYKNISNSLIKSVEQMISDNSSYMKLDEINDLEVNINAIKSLLNQMAPDIEIKGAISNLRSIYERSLQKIHTHKKVEVIPKPSLGG